MSVTVNINGLSLCHRLSGGVSRATLPDVCNTPGRGAVPYPNVALARDLAKGTTTVQADGADMCANFGSEFSRSTGDEPGTSGGVTSQVNMREATWMTYSFDVKLEGKGACRLTDKMFHNRRNTVNMAGLTQPPVKPPSDPACAALYEAIYRLIWAVRSAAGQGTQGLAWRWRATALNRGNWTEAENATHMQAYKEQRQALRKAVNKWKRNHCDDNDLPPGTAEYASDQLPDLGPGKSEAPTPMTAQFGQYLKGAGIAAAGVATGFIIFEVITRIIRLIPPLWPLQASPI